MKVRKAVIFERGVLHWIAVCLCVISIAFISKSAQAELEYPALHCLTHTTTKNPPPNYNTFNNVERVVIILQSESDESKLQQNKISDILSRSNILKTAKEIYELRYRELDRADDYDPGCYGRANQPVKALPFATEEQRKKARKLSLKKGTLTVFIRLQILSPEKAKLGVVNYRPHVNQSWWRDWIDMPVPFWEAEAKSFKFSLKQKNKKIQTTIEDIIASRID